MSTITMANTIDFAQYGIKDIHRLAYHTMDQSDQKDFIKLFAIMNRHITLPNSTIPQKALPLVHSYLETIAKVQAELNQQRHNIDVIHDVTSSMQVNLQNKFKHLSFMDESIQQYICAHITSTTYVSYKFNNISQCLQLKKS